jgi:hypothetical protein
LHAFGVSGVPQLLGASGPGVYPGGILPLGCASAANACVKLARAAIQMRCLIRFLPSPWEDNPLQHPLANHTSKTVIAAPFRTKWSSRYVWPPLIHLRIIARSGTNCIPVRSAYPIRPLQTQPRSRTVRRSRVAKLDHSLKPSRGSSRGLPPPVRPVTAFVHTASSAGAAFGAFACAEMLQSVS